MESYKSKEKESSALIMLQLVWNECYKRRWQNNWYRVVKNHKWLEDRWRETQVEGERNSVIITSIRKSKVWNVLKIRKNNDESRVSINYTDTRAKLYNLLRGCSSTPMDKMTKVIFVIFHWNWQAKKGRRRRKRLFPSWLGIDELCV